MALIPEALIEHINAAYPECVCLVGTVQPGGWVQIAPRGSLLVYDADTLAYWDRGSGTTHDQVSDGTLVTVFFRNSNIREILPKGGIARFYGTATVHTEGPVRDEVYEKMVQPERDKDPDKKGRAVILKLQRAEDNSHAPLVS